MLKPGLRTKLLFLPRILDFQPFWLIIFVLELHELPLYQVSEDLAKDDLLVPRILFTIRHQIYKFLVERFSYNWLIDLQLKDSGVHECTLGDPLQSELVHQVDLVRVSQVFPHEGLHGEGEGGGVEEDLHA